MYSNYLDEEFDPECLTEELWEVSTIEDKYMLLCDFVRYISEEATITVGMSEDNSSSVLLLKHKNKLHRIPIGDCLAEYDVQEAKAFATGLSVITNGILDGYLNTIETAITEDIDNPTFVEFEVSCPKCNEPAIPDNDAILCASCGLVK